MLKNEDEVEESECFYEVTILVPSRKVIGVTMRPIRQLANCFKYLLHMKHGLHVGEHQKLFPEWDYHDYLGPVAFNPTYNIRITLRAVFKKMYWGQALVFVKRFPGNSTVQPLLKPLVSLISIHHHSQGRGRASFPKNIGQWMPAQHRETVTEGRGNGNGKQWVDRKDILR